MSYAQTGQPVNVIKTKLMNGTDYLVAIGIEDNNPYTSIRLHKILEQLQLMGTSYNGLDMNLYVLPASNKTIPELTGQLQAVPGVKEISIVALSNSIQKKELDDVRSLLKGLGIDARSLSDKELKKYLTSSLAGESTYYLDSDFNFEENKLAKVKLKLIADLIRDTPAHDSTTDEIVSDTTEIIDGMEIRKVTVGYMVEIEPPPPPPVPPANLSQMSDVQIRRWIRKNDARELKDRNITVERSATEIKITIKYKGATETIGYIVRQ